MMGRFVLLLLAGVAYWTTCMAQIGGMGGMGGMMGGMGGMMGGIRAMMGGEGGGMGGMGMGAMISSMITPIIANFIATSKMNELVKGVMGPHAVPSSKMIEYAKLQRRIPANVNEMVPYIEMMTELSKTMGIMMRDGKIKRPAPEKPLGGAISQTGNATKTKSDFPTIAEVQQLIVERGIIWYNSQPKPPPNANQGPPSSGMGGIFGF